MSETDQAQMVEEAWIEQPPSSAGASDLALDEFQVSEEILAHIEAGRTEDEGPPFPCLPLLPQLVSWSMLSLRLSPSPVK